MITWHLIYFFSAYIFQNETEKKNVVRCLHFQGGGTKILQISLIFQATTERIPGFVFDFLSALMALPSHHVQPDFSRVLVALLVIGLAIAFF